MAYQRKVKIRGGKKLLQVHIFTDQDKKLKEIQLETGYPIAFLIREAIDLLALKYKTDATSN